MNDPLMASELVELESSLRSFAASGNVNRDELLFEAGRRSAVWRPAPRSRFWKAVSTALAMLLVGQSFFFWSAADGRVADRKSTPSESSLEISVSSEQERTVTSSTVFPADGMLNQAGNRKQDTLSTRRPEFLQLRRVALAHGVDAAFSSSVSDAGDTVETDSTRQNLLLELLGS
jgi:hypothetical protein